ncbi:MAG: efflux RND transporter permease subunit [Saprospiraceae bacterium]|jgi:multidrug efflux pump subunit AcrB|nr:efflux RND transporter permease subunit [Saprospiraceae bacterium]MBK6480073.1 efflux RND transporter permease subunit [Saprospiraceae bacterium]MBK6815070.1 efflux RND transporter permease subunit [Saprospiraceae bacterium]MBK7372113.1 efflux RND transporter permease subunit [Saprospiraceae bacterium]MBK7435426.1 efflux RND transporter permease subunit [Saprospiraceae bacterium]
MNLTSFSVKNYQFTIIIFILALALGLNSLLNMPRGEDPPFGAPIFIVLAVYPGTSPADMEQLVADPIEEALYNLGDVKKIVTTCSDGLMMTQIDFNYGVNVDNKNNDVNREMNKIRRDLPDGLLELRVQRASSSDVVILQSALVSETATTTEINDYAEDLKKSLERVRDLKWVHIQGEPNEIIDIQLRLSRMASMGIGINQVMGAIAQNNINIPGGTIDLNTKRYNIKTNSDLKTLDDIRNIIVHTGSRGQLVRLHEVADVYATNEEQTHIARFNGKPAVWVLSALNDRKNIIQTRARMQTILDEYESRLPSHIKLQHAFDQEVSVEHRLGGLSRDFSIAIFLVLLTLVPLGIRASLVVLISIPLSLAIGLALLHLLGFTLNQLSIVGMVIALGLLVDDSIVVVENIERFMRQGYSRKEASIVATKQIFVAVLGCTATLIFAFLPLAFLPEGSGEFIRSLPIAVLVTIIASLFVALTIIPFLSSLLLKKHERAEGNFFMRAFKKYINDPYASVLKWAFKHPILTILGTILIFMSSLMIVPRIGFSLFPKSDKPMFVVDIKAASGSSINQTNHIARQLEQDLLRQPNIVSVSTNVGKGNPRVYYNEFQQNYSPTFAQLLVQVPSNLDVPAITTLTDSLRKRYEGMPEAEVEVKMFQQGTPILAPIEFRIIGENLDTLKKYAGEVEKIISNTQGTQTVRNTIKTPKTDLGVNIDKAKAGMLGVLPAEVAKTVRLGLAGLEVGSLLEDGGDEKTIRVSVGKPDLSQSLEVFDQLYVQSMSGAQVPLKQIATISLDDSPLLIRHYNKERTTSVTSFVKTGYNTMQLIEEIEEKTKAVQLPPGYRFVAAGEKESQEESFGGMGTIVLISIFCLFAILVLEFRTFKSTMIVLSVVPLGVIGALCALWVGGETLSFVATIGIIALMGIEIKNSILLVDYTNQLREGGMDLKQAIMNGAETRFLPILLTSMTAIGGMVPLVLENSPLISPLAMVLIGGLISSTLLSRIVTPLLYYLIPPAVQVQQVEMD